MRPARADAGRAASAGPGSPGELEEGRRAPAKCSSGAASLNPPSYSWSGTHLNPFHRREAQRPAQPPKVTQPGSYPAAADFKTFLPRRIANPSTFRCGALTTAKRARALALPGARSPGRLLCPRRGQPGPCSLPGLQSQARLPGQLRGRRGTAAPALTQHRRCLQSGRRGTHLKEEETEAPREPATSPRAHRAGTQSRAAGCGLGTPGPAGQRSPPLSPRAPPAGYSQPVLPSSSRTSSDAEWAAPMVPAAGWGPGTLVRPRPWAGVSCAAAAPASGPTHRSGRQERV